MYGWGDFFMSVFQFDSGKTAKAVVLGAVTSAAVVTALTFVISGILLFMSVIPYDVLPYILLAADAVGAIVGGYTAAAITKERGLITGLMCSGAVYLLMLLAGFIFDGGTLTVISVLKPIVMLISGALGGIKGVNRKERLRIH